MKKVVNLLTKITKKIVSKIKREKMNKELEFAKNQKKIKEPKSILFSDCGNCRQARGKPNNTQNNQLLKRVLFWREEYNENKTNEKRGEKSMGRRGSEELINNGLKIKNKLAICMLMILMMVIPGINLFGNEVKAVMRGVMYDFYGENYTYEDLLYEPGDSEENSNRDYHFYITPNEGYVIKSVEIDYIYARVEDFNSYGNENEWNVVYTYPTEDPDLYEFSVTVTTEKGIDWSKALITEWTIPVDADGAGKGTTILLPIPKHANNNYTVDWGDGSTTQTFDSTADFQTHTYTNTAETVYTIKIAGTVNAFGYNNNVRTPTKSTDAKYYTFTQYLTGLKQWGELNATYYGFAACTKLSGEIPLPTENSFKNVTTMVALFRNCTSLTGEIPATLFAKAPNVTVFERTFCNCTGLTGEIPANLFANNPLVTTFNSVFSTCSGLTGTISENLFANNLLVKNFEAAFLNCNGLTGSIPAKLFEKNELVTSFAQIFNGCSKLTGSIPANLFAKTTQVTTFWQTFSSCSGLTGEIPSELFKNTPLVTTFFNLFRGCSGLTGNIPADLFINTTQVTDFGSTFLGCKGLTGEISADLFAKTELVTTFAYTFHECNGLTGSIPENLFSKTTQVKKFDGTFYGCSKLTGSIPANLFSNTPLVETFAHIFRGCSSLTGSIPANLFSNKTLVTTYAYTFYGCKGLTGEIPSTLFEKNEKVETFFRTFMGCTSLTGEIPADLFKSTPLVNSFSETFESCSGLTGEVPAELFANNTVITTIPTQWNTSNNGDAFYQTFNGCKGLTGANINTLYLGYQMFYGCNKLTDITIGNNVQEIGTDALQATAPYSATSTLGTKLTTTNELATNYDWAGDNRRLVDADSVFITDWTIPVDADGAGKGTTIKLPIPKNTKNMYTVDWGDGSEVQIFDNTADFPAHTYKNTVETTYTIKINGNVNEFGLTFYAYATATNTYKNYYAFTQYLTALKQWGELCVSKIGFANCKKLAGTIPASTENTFKEATTAEYLFYSCSKITGRIPEDLFQNGTKIKSFYNTFYYCKGLTGSIPENLFKSATNATSFESIFYNCEGLTGSIPANLFATTTGVTTFKRTFSLCTGLTGSIPENLFTATTEVTDFYDTFYYCTGLTGNIPENLFATTTEVTNFGATFMYCSGLTGSIPANLFAKTTKVDSFYGTFGYCSGLTGSIPENLFAKTTKVDSFYNTFSDCSGLTGNIPENLFTTTTAVTNFCATFSNCSGLTGSISENLFATTTEVTNFSSTFGGCSGLTGNIPENLFATTTEAMSFGSTFSGCSGLTGSIPANLFSKTTEAYYFACIFEGCSGLTGSIPENLFANTDKQCDFSRTFYGCSGLTGSIPKNLFSNTYGYCYFIETFANCTGLTGEVPVDLLQEYENPFMYWNWENDLFYGTFYGCTGLEKVNINTQYIGYKMFYGCNSLTDITIGDNVIEIAANAFTATEPYSRTNPLITKLTTTNDLALVYNWKADNRDDNKTIVNEPEDVNTEENIQASFNVVVSGDNLSYKWYEIDSGNERELSGYDLNILKSNIEGQSGATATKTIRIAATESKKLSFEYMVSSEQNGDTLTITIEDANGITTAVNSISGEVGWTEYSQECVPTAEGEIFVTLTYSKNGSVDSGKDYGAIRRLKYSNLEKHVSTFETDENFVITTPYYVGDSALVIDTINGEKVFRNEGYNIENSQLSAWIEFNLSDTVEAEVKFDLKINALDGEYYTKIEYSDYNEFPYKVLRDGEEATDGWATYTVKLKPVEDQKPGILIQTETLVPSSDPTHTVQIKNLSVTTGSEELCTFENDETYTVTSDIQTFGLTEEEWKTISYDGTNSSTLTLSEDLVTLDMDGNKYYAKVSSPFGSITTREALLTVGESYDWSNALVTEWTIPVDADGAGLGTTIKLPIPKYGNNNYNVDWGDGSAVETFGGTADFPTHNYKNTEVTTYTIKISGNVNQFGYDYYVTPTATNNYKNYYTFTKYLTGLVQWGELNARSYGFSNCSNLSGSIPASTENTFKEAMTAQLLFYYCRNLTGNIPDKLFQNGTKIKNFTETFSFCRGLTGSIPENLFVNTTVTTVFESTFYYCEGLTGSIPENLFATSTAATKFSSVFSSCKGLTGSIPEKLFAKTTKATYFGSVFSYCSGLTGSIPENLFANTPEATYFGRVFSSCSGLTGSIPENLFASAPEATSFYGTFSSCSGLTGSIPEILFTTTKKVTDFSSTFAGCSSLTGSIPATLFETTTEVTDFANTFENCSSLTGSIPATLFATTTEVTDFSSTFEGCSSLTGSIPATLFETTTEVTYFSNTFAECSSLTGSIPENLFVTTTKVISFGYTFYGCSNLTGNIPENLFAKTINVKGFSGTFAECSSLTGSIPENLFANTVEAIEFYSTFRECSGLTGSVPGNLFEKTTKAVFFMETFRDCIGLTEVEEGIFTHLKEITFYGYWDWVEYDTYSKTFYGCTGLEKINLNTLYVGYMMFYGCNNLTDITIGDRVIEIAPNSFTATDPYSKTNPLKTKLTTTNDIALMYNWKADNRDDNKIIVNEPEDVNTKENTQASFNVVVSGDHLSYKWYEIDSGNERELNGHNLNILKSNIEGKSSTTATKTIRIASTESKTLSFEYMVSSEKKYDTFTITIEDANGITTAVNAISGEVGWTEYSQECVPTTEDEIFVTLTYTKDNAANSGKDFGAIRRLKYSNLEKYVSTFETDENIIIDGYNFVVDTINGEKVLRNDTYNVEDGYADVYIVPNLLGKTEAEISFDFKVNAMDEEYNTSIEVSDNGPFYYRLLRTSTSGTSGWERYKTKLIPYEEEETYLLIRVKTLVPSDDPAHSVQIKNLSITTGSEALCTFENDETFTVTSEIQTFSVAEEDWKTISYAGTNSSTLTISEDLVTLDMDGNKYYAKISSPFGSIDSREALLTVKESLDWDKALVTEWTIPVDADQTNGTTTTNASGDTITLGAQTTINLPISKNDSNKYAVDWGDGVIERFDSTANLPSHTYTNIEETTYTIKIAGSVYQFGYFGTSKPTGTNSGSTYYPFTEYLTGLKAWGEINTTRYGFSQCVNLSSTIPEPTENSFKNVRWLADIFNNCFKLSGSIPENLFEGVTEVSWLDGAFKNCSSLTGTIPGTLFATTTKASIFWHTFENCSGLTGISENLFANTPNAQQFDYAFAGCTGLTSIPENLFKNTTNVVYFRNTFAGCTGLTSIPEKLFQSTKPYTQFTATFMDCTGLTGEIPAELFANQRELSLYTYWHWGNDILSGTFAGCTGIEKVTLDTIYIGSGMFYGCTNLTDITIGDNVMEIGPYAFAVEQPYSKDNPLITKLTTTNDIALVYNWESENRNDSKVIVNEPQDVNTEENVEAKFNAVVSGNNLSYQWYEIASGDERKLNQYDLNILKSNIEGQSGATATKTIRIASTESKKLSFEYMVSSEQNGDTLTITIEDANGTTTAVNAISGEVGWTEYSKECVPTAEGEIFVTLTYSKNGSVDSGKDCGAIRRLKYSNLEMITSTFENDDRFTITSPGRGSDYGFVVDTINGETVFRNDGYNDENGDADAVIELNLAGLTGARVNFDFRVNAADGDYYTNIMVIDGDPNSIKSIYDYTTVPERILRYSAYTTDGWESYSVELFPKEGDWAILNIGINNYASSDDPAHSVQIKNLSISTGSEELCTFENDETFTVTSDIQTFGLTEEEWTVIPYIGTNTETLTIPEDVITLDMNGNKYYAKVSSPFGSIKTRQALLTVEESYDWETSFITKWSIPVNANGSGLGTTIKLPIPAHAENDFAVDWGDGGPLEEFDSTANFPTHTYTNTSTTTYEITIAGKVDSFGYYEEAVPTNPSDSTVTTRVAEDYYTFIQYVTGVKSWGEIGVSRIGFANCTKLADSLPTPTLKTFENVTSMEKVLFKCTALSGNIPANLFASATKATSFKDAFNGCMTIAGTIPESLFATNVEVISFENTFRNCNGLTDAIPGKLFAKNKKVTTFVNAFKDCIGLSGAIPGELFSINKEVTDFSGTFSGCTNLSGMIPGRLFLHNDKVTNYSNTFENCGSLTAGELQIDTTNVTNMDGMFKNCVKLESVVFGEDVSKLVGTDVFSNCSELRAVIFLKQPNSTAELGQISDLTTLALPSGAMLYVPYAKDEEKYEKVWTNISTEKIEMLVKPIPNPDYVGKGTVFVDDGYTVAGFGMDETEKYTQYGFYVVVDGANEIDTNQLGSQWINYTLYKK